MQIEQDYRSKKELDLFILYLGSGFLKIDLFYIKETYSL